MFEQDTGTEEFLLVTINLKQQWNKGSTQLQVKNFYNLLLLIYL